MRNFLASLLVALLLLGSGGAHAQTYTCAKGSQIGGGLCRFYETTTSSSNQTDTWPSDWTNTNTIETIGGGGAEAKSGSTQFGEGCGGAYNIRTNDTTFTASQTVAFHILVAASTSTGGTGLSGGDVYLCNSTSNCATIAGTAVRVGSKGGGGGLGNTSSACTQALTASGVPTTGGFNGGIGGHNSTSPGGLGGGAAGSPLGAGGNGASGTTQNGGNGGGGTCSHNGVAATTASGAAGGQSCDGTAGGPGSTSGNPAASASAGVHGAGGGGMGGNTGTTSAAANKAGDGGPGVEWDSTHGAGGGGGGSGGSGTLTFSAGKPGNGGLYGGGAGGSGDDSGFNPNATVGVGAQGLVTVTYQSSTWVPPTAGSATFLFGFP